MRIDDRDAKQLCTKDEYALYRSSLEAESLAPKERAARLRRARALRNKYRDLYRRQSRDASGKAGGTPRPMEEAKRTQAKARLFEETAERFQAAPDREKGAPSPRRAASPAGSRPESGRPPLGSKSASSIYGTPPPGPGKAVKTVYTKQRMGHFGSATKRRQARRNSGS